MLKPIPFNVRNHYWIVAGSTTQVYSSKEKAYVSVANSDYSDWLARGKRPTKIPTEAELFAVLAEHYPEGLPDNAAAIEARRSDLIGKLTAEKVGIVLATGLFNHENRIRALEGKGPVTKAAFIAALKALL